MEEVLIQYETAKLAEKLNIDLKLFSGGFEYYDEDGNRNWTSIEGGSSGDKNTKEIVCCSQSLLQKYLREVCKIVVVAIPSWTKESFMGYRPDILELSKNYFDWMYDGIELYSSYEESLEVGLKRALLLLTNQQS